MKIIIFSILCLHVNSFINNYKYRPLIKPQYNSISNFYCIEPFNTIITYDIDHLKIMEIQNEINEKTNNRFIIKKNNIYISIYDYSDNNHKEHKSKCQIFVYVYDSLNNIYGQYILETKQYNNNNNNKSIIFSFYESNQQFYTSFSCYQYNYDNINYTNDLIFNFIYDNNKYFKNTNIYDKISYFPSYIYSSELRYKNTLWKKSNQVFYYKNNFIYEEII